MLSFLLIISELPLLYFLDFRAPLSLEKSAAASIVRSVETSTTTRRIDPAADLREATERNAREAREEEADRLAREQAALSATSAERVLALAEAQAAEMERLTETVHHQEPLLMAPLNTASPPLEF